MHFLSKKIRKYTSLITKCSYKTSLPNRWHYPIEINTDQMYIHIYIWTKQNGVYFSIHVCLVLFLVSRSIRESSIVVERDVFDL